MVLITKAKEQSKKLVQLLAANKINYAIFPAIQIKKLNTTLMHNNYDVIIFISTNAVKYGVKYIKNINRQQYLLLAVGNATANALKKYNFMVDYYPLHKPSSISLLELSAVKKIKHKKCLIIRGLAGEQTLKNTLIKNNNIVDYLEVYQRIISDITTNHIIEFNKFIKSNNQIILITSIDILNAVIKLVQIMQINFLLKKIKLLVISDRIEKYAKSLGFNNIINSNDINIDSIMMKLK